MHSYAYRRLGLLPLAQILLALICALGSTPAEAWTTSTPYSTPPPLYLPLLVTNASCVNGGELIDGKCECPLYYTGETCAERQCPHSTKGRGPNKIAPVNPSTKFCDNCDSAAFDGLNCQLCQNNGACAAEGGQEGYSCNQTLVIHGNAKNFQCELDSPYFLRLMGDDRNITAQIMIECNTTDGEAFREQDNGVCHMAIYRLEPDASYVDPFFRCDTRSCSMHHGVRSAQDDDDDSLLLRLFGFLLVAGQVTLVLLCAALALLGAFAKLLGQKRLRRITLALALTIATTAVVYVVLMILGMRSTAATETVIYECKHTHCACAEDPPVIYQPICSESDILARNILPSIQNSIRIECALGTQNCQLTLADLSLVFGAVCRAAECVNESAFPYWPPVDDGTLHPSQQLVLVLFILVVLSCVGLVAHWLFTRWRSRYLAQEFIIRFHLPHSTTALHDPALHPGEHSLTSSSSLAHVSPAAAVAPREGDGTTDNAYDYGEEGSEHHEDRDYGIGDGNVPQGDSPCPTQAAMGSESNLRNSEQLQPSTITIRASVLHRAAQQSPEEMAKVDELRRLTSAAMELRVVDLQYTLQPSRLADKDDADSRVILHGVNFVVGSGEVLAIMGPSGAGKTTLLDMLSARAKSGVVRGSITLNGTPITTATDNRAAEYRNIIGYVSQEDTLLPALTVRQTIEYAARLKLPRAFAQRTIERIVDQVVHLMRLKQCENILVGDGANIRGVSGGEKRRVSIAVELLANPRLLFLDEPTSGLDTVSAKHVMEAVVALSKNSPMRVYAPHYFAFQPIVVFSIHQPSTEIFNMFDKVLLLSQGVSVYCGAAQTATGVLQERVSQAFGHTRAVPRCRAQDNPAEYLMKLEEMLDDAVRLELLEAETRDTSPALRAASPTTAPPQGDHLIGTVALPAPQQLTLLTAPGVEVDGDAILRATTDFRKYYVNIYQQLSLLTSRSTTCLITSFHLVVCHAAVVACLASLMCFLYPEQALDLPGSLNRAGSVTFVLLVTSFVSLSALEQLVMERKLFVLERENGFYSTFPYLLSKVAVDIVPMRVIPAIVLTSVIYFPMGFRIDAGSHFFWFILIVVLFSVSMTLMIMCIGVLSGTFGAAALLSSVFILWNFVFGGSMVQAQTIPYYLKPFKMLSPFFLAFESLMVNELDGQACVFSPTDETGKPSSASIPIMCVQYLANVGLVPAHFGTDVMQLALYCFVFLLLAWILLATCTKIVR